MAFTIVRFKEGYDMGEVDDFLRRAERGGLTAADVRDVVFSTTRFRRAYDVDEVDDYLDRLAARLDGGRPLDSSHASGPTREDDVPVHPVADASSDGDSAVAIGASDGDSAVNDSIFLR